MSAISRFFSNPERRRAHARLDAMFLVNWFYSVLSSLGEGSLAPPRGSLALRRRDALRSCSASSRPLASPALPIVTHACRAGLYNKEGKLLLLGLDNAGKTTLLKRLTDGRMSEPSPTFHPSASALSRSAADAPRASCARRGR
jgi:hypothetical protein